MNLSKHPITMPAQGLQSECPAGRDTARAPIADDVGLKVECFGQCGDSTGCLDGLVEDIHGGHDITQVSAWLLE